MNNYSIAFSTAPIPWRDYPNLPSKKVFDNINFNWTKIDLNPNYINEQTINLVFPLDIDPTYIQIKDNLNNTTHYFWFVKNTKRLTNGLEKQFSIDIWTSIILVNFDKMINNELFKLNRLWKTFKFVKSKRAGGEVWNSFNGLSELDLSFLTTIEPNLICFPKSIDRINAKQHYPDSTINTFSALDTEVGGNKHLLLNKYYVFEKKDITQNTGEQNMLVLFPLDEDESGLTNILKTTRIGYATLGGTNNIAKNHRENLDNKIVNNANRFLGVYKFIEFASLVYVDKLEKNLVDFNLPTQSPNVNINHENATTQCICIEWPKAGILLDKKINNIKSIVASTNPNNNNNNIARWTQRVFINPEGVSMLELAMYEWRVNFNNGFKLIGNNWKGTRIKTIDFGGEQFNSSNQFKTYLAQNKGSLIFNEVTKTLSGIIDISKNIASADYLKAGASGLNLVTGIGKTLVDLNQRQNNTGFSTSFVGDTEAINSQISYSYLFANIQKDTQGYFYYSNVKNLGAKDSGFLFNVHPFEEISNKYLKLVNEHFIYNGVNGVGYYSIPDLLKDNPTCLLQFDANDFAKKYLKYYSNVDKKLTSEVIKKLSIPFFYWSNKAPNNNFEYTYNLVEVQ